MYSIVVGPSYALQSDSPDIRSCISNQLPGDADAVGNPCSGRAMESQNLGSTRTSKWSRRSRSVAHEQHLVHTIFLKISNLLPLLWESI